MCVCGGGGGPVFLKSTRYTTVPDLARIGGRLVVLQNVGLSVGSCLNR